jgi:hypothetical protein
MRRPVRLIDQSSGEFVEASLFDEVTMEHFLEAQEEWRPLVLMAARRLARSGASVDDLPRHWHWDWTAKEAELQMLAITFYGVECRGRLQGLMKAETVAHRCRLAQQRGKPLVYVDYLEVAPCNIKKLMEPLGRQPELGAVGTRLIAAAVHQSRDEGFDGRVGLHSLPTSERFYLEACGMVAGERDAEKQNLLWCEFTPERAKQFVAGGHA